MASSATTAVVEEEDRRPIATATSEAAPMDTSAQDLDPDDISSRARAFIAKKRDEAVSALREIFAKDMATYKAINSY